MTEMRRKIAELFEYMDATRASLLACARDMNQSFAVIRPRAGEWSAAENLAHLALVESNVTRMMEKTIAAAREQGVGPDRSEKSFINSLDKWRVPDAVPKLIAPSRIVPDTAKTVRDSIESLEQTRARLKSIILENSDMDLASIKRPHPVLGEIDMYQWGLFVPQHEERHRKQMERALAEVTERAAECAPIV
jgi:hypothetical protein